MDVESIALFQGFLCILAIFIFNKCKAGIQKKAPTKTNMLLAASLCHFVFSSSAYRMVQETEKLSLYPLLRPVY